MTALTHFAETPLAAALGWAILHSLWQGALVSTFLWTALKTIRSPRLRYAVACTALLAMLAGFSFTVAQALPAQARRVHRFPIGSLPVWKIPLTDVATSSLQFALASVAPWLGPIWLAGVWLFGLFQFGGWLSLQRLCSRGVFAPSDHWHSELRRLSANLKLSRPVRLLESCLSETPVVLGHFRPVVLLPIGLLSALPADQVEAILLHELIHIRRHDYLVNAWQRLAEVFFFYHPAAWWISRVIRIEREHCCDDAVVLITRDARSYAEALAALEQNRLWNYSPAIAATGGHLMNRIHRLLIPGRPESSWAPLVALAIFLATAGVSAAALLSPAHVDSRWQEQSGAMPSLSHYDKWLDQDVVYIIDDAERAAFLALSTDAERDRFIEQFWDRRNPTPGSSQNAFKDEHYHRIAFATSHFKTQSGTPGWLNDRGHMYIVFGAPDEIETHSKTAQAAFATEVWLYHHLQALGDNVQVTFVDRSGTGDYRVLNFLDRKSPGEVRFLPVAPAKSQNEPPKPVRAGVNGVGIPACEYCPAPAHNKNGHTGVVVLKVVVSLDGQAENIAKISGADELVAIAIDTVKTWHFRPAKDSSGQPVTTEVPVEVTFRSSN